MDKIQIQVTNRRAVTLGAPVIVCGNSDYRIAFTLDAEWNDVTLKTARFVYVQDGEVKYQDVIFEGTEVDVPVFANVTGVRVGLFAGDLKTSTPAVIPCQYSIRCGTGAPVDPTPSQYDQIMMLLATGDGVETINSLPVVDQETGDIYRLYILGGRLVMDKYEEQTE